MPAEQSLRDGDLEQALAELQAEVRKDPSNAKHRIFLFQLYSLLGQWDRANTQLGVVAEMDASTLPMVQTYREALKCEALRGKVFTGDRSPLVFGRPEPWVALLLEALRLSATGKIADSQRLRADALEQAQATSGTIDEQAFAWIADADPRLGPILETIVNGRYYWIPFRRLRSVSIDKPTDLRDLVWAPVKLQFANGGETVAFVPTRYVGSEESSDPEVRMARRTDWVDRGDDLFEGTGLRMFATDQGEYPLLETREIRLDSPDEAPADAGGLADVDG
jgi:type VI secretion system protein ImpE